LGKLLSQRLTEIVLAPKLSDFEQHGDGFGDQTRAVAGFIAFHVLPGQLIGPIRKIPLQKAAQGILQLEQVAARVAHASSPLSQKLPPPLSPLQGYAFKNLTKEWGFQRSETAISTTEECRFQSLEKFFWWTNPKNVPL